MFTILRKLAVVLFAIACAIFYSVSACALDQLRGIYITQDTMKNGSYLSYLIRRSKEVGINTFVIDLERLTNYYSKNYNGQC